jgi:hypothetical protein
MNSVLVSESEEHGFRDFEYLDRGVHTVRVI